MTSKKQNLQLDYVLIVKLRFNIFPDALCVLNVIKRRKIMIKLNLFKMINKKMILIL